MCHQIFCIGILAHLNWQEIPNCDEFKRQCVAPNFVCWYFRSFDSFDSFCARIVTNLKDVAWRQILCVGIFAHLSNSIHFVLVFFLIRVI